VIVEQLTPAVQVTAGQRGLAGVTDAPLTVRAGLRQ